jgi:hypothetical protein
MNRANCQCCSQPRAELKQYKSKLIDGMTLLMCNDCILAKFEPRFVIILTARAKGHDSVKEYIQKRRYVGAPIEASDILV